MDALAANSTFLKFNSASENFLLAKKKLFYTWLKNKKKLGGQNKVPRLCNNRGLMEELLKLN